MTYAVAGPRDREIASDHYHCKYKQAHMLMYSHNLIDHNRASDPQKAARTMRCCKQTIWTGEQPLVHAMMLLIEFGQEANLLVQHECPLQQETTQSVSHDSLTSRWPGAQ